ncbi:MAG: sigma-54-dependent Fis family transcriptional regulator, partial [Nitrospina sp.]|nr:sigma-54-dependent Fis family transcriptional regulator [Nitrospina sp.]
LNTQVKLLRYLQEKSFERVGGTKKIFTKTRVIAATNKDLDEMVKKGSFREDLYYRLAVFPITIPPLRERKDDISSLAIHFVTLYKKEFDKEISSITPEAINVLENYFWPGNVRELGNVIYQAMIMTGTNFIDIDSLPVNVKNKNTQKTSEAVVSQYASSKGDFVEPFDTSVRQVLQRALDLTNGDIPKTAKRLKLSRSSFYRMVQKYDLTKPFSKN